MTPYDRDTKVCLRMPLILSESSIKQYQTEGFTLVKGVVTNKLLTILKDILTDWSNKTILDWKERNLIWDIGEDLPFESRLAVLWEKAGRPKYIRSPRRDLICEELFNVLRHPTLLDISQDLLDSPDISVHGIFNGRPKLPDQLWTRTPWHQDAQYYPDAETKHVLSIWIPLQRVNEHNSCLQVAPRSHNIGLFEPYNYPETEFLGLSPEDQKKLIGLSVPMALGDALCFSQCTPHRALPNKSRFVRWSMDFRYEATNNSTETGRRQGFQARNSKNPNLLPSYEEWLRQWISIPRGTY